MVNSETTDLERLLKLTYWQAELIQDIKLNVMSIIGHSTLPPQEKIDALINLLQGVSESLNRTLNLLKVTRDHTKPE